MYNGVEVLVRDKSTDGKQEQRKIKVMDLSPMKTSKIHVSSTLPNKLLLSSAVATVVNRHQMSASFPLHQLMQHNYIIKTCMTTYTYLTTVVQNKRSAVSTFETIVSVVTTESLTNLYATDVLTDLKPTKVRFEVMEPDLLANILGFMEPLQIPGTVLNIFQTKYMEVKTIQASATTNMFSNSIPKVEKRIDNQEEHNFDLLQPSEIGHAPCTSSCTCSHTKTEVLKTKYTHVKPPSLPMTDKYGIKNTKYNGMKIESRPTRKESIDQTLYHPYEYETSSQGAPTDKIVEKYTQVNDYSDESDSDLLQSSDLLTNEQAPPSKINKGSMNSTSEKVKPEKPQKVNKNKLVMAELIKLGSLGIKGLSQLAPVIEKMTGGFMKRQEINRTVSTTTTVKPTNKLTSYKANKRVDNDLETKVGNFPIYIPVDEMETAESQTAYSNVTLHQNFAWAAENKHPKSHIVKPKIIYESPLLNGGIPISPGEIITTNSDVIVGKPAVGGPLTLAASGIKLHSPVHPPLVDNIVANNEQYLVKEKPLNDQSGFIKKTDDSYDLRPPEPPKIKSQPIKHNLRQHAGYYGTNMQERLPSTSHVTNEPVKQLSVTKNKTPLIVNQGRPSFLDFIPSLNKPSNTPHSQDYHLEHKPKGIKQEDILDNNPSSSEIISTKLTTNGEFADAITSDSESKPFLVDIQPSRVANVLIPHGSSTALVFAGSSEPHKTGDYVDDPLPYPEPGYFGSFSIDAPHMTNVHNVFPNTNQFLVKPDIKNVPQSYKETGFNNDYKFKWNDNKRPKDLVNLPPPTSKQETHVQVGPKITSYNPNVYNADVEKNKKLNNKITTDMNDIIDKEYENYLAVPPPPPKMHFNPETLYDKNNYHRRPIVHTKPIHDSNVFLNIQHPVSNQLPPRVTSEIYFASQLQNNEGTSTYAFKIPQTATINGNSQIFSPKKTNNQIQHNIVSSSNSANKSIITSNNKANTYSITLNTATNVASKSNSGHVVGSSITVPITTSTSLNGQINANIPIGTNFAIRVEDDPSKYESVALHGKRHPSLILDNHDDTPKDNFSVYKSNKLGFKTNITQSILSGSPKEAHINVNIGENLNNKDFTNRVPPSINSHANFPMMHEDTKVHLGLRPNYESNKNIHVQTKPKLEVLTNSHGWYASVLKEDNLKNIQVEATTRKVIPINFDSNSNSLPEFGEKIATAGKPPTEFWSQKDKQTINNFSIGKPFSRPNPEENINIPPLTIKPNYVPSPYDNKQAVYDIPVRDNSYEISSSKPIYSNAVKPVYETAEEIYDGEEEPENNSEIDGEVSSESMKVPIITSSIGKENITKTYASTEGHRISQSNLNESKSDVRLVNFNPGTQTEKPFSSYNKTTFQTNSLKPIYDNKPYMKPRPFTTNTVIPLDHQLQQPHWQINQLMENATNVSYEDNVELNIGEEKYTVPTRRPFVPTKSNYFKEIETEHKKQQRPINRVIVNTTKLSNESNIITSTVQIQDKRPLIVDINEKSTLPTFTIKTESERFDNSSSEIIDLSPPPPTVNHKYNPSNTDEIMGMSPPPQRNSLQRIPTRPPQTPRPVIPKRPLPTRQSTQRPTRKPITRDEVSTYRPTYDILNKIKRPSFNIDQISSHLLPPPRELPIRPKPSINSVTSVIFPTPISSSWITSSNFDFPAFGPTSVLFPDISSSSKLQEDSDTLSSETSSENIYDSNEYETSSEISDVIYKRPVTQKPLTIFKQTNRTKPYNKESENSMENGKYTPTLESNQEDTVKDKMKVIPILNKNRTRKPYPSRNDDKKINTNKFKLPTKPVPVNILESSESSIVEEYIKPTDVLKEIEISTLAPEITSIIEKTITSTLTISKDPMESNIHITHHAGNEIKISDEIIPTKTEFKTTIITLTKTLSEPPQTVSSIGYVNLTHTLTVTHTETSLISQSEGAVTQTLVLTHTQTSTIVDIVTEVYTKVQPTTIVETVTKHIPILQVQPTPVIDSLPPATIALDDITMSSEESDNFIIRDNDVTENIQKIEIEEEKDNNTFFVVMNKSQNGGKSPPINTDIETGDYDGITRNEEVSNNGVSQVLFGEILLAGTPYLETTNVGHPTGLGFGKECQPDCKASRNERCQRIDSIMKCVCRPGFARMFPDRPCKPTYTYSVRLALGSQGNERLKFHTSLSDNSSKEYHGLAVATHEGINRMIMQSDLRDVYHGVHITGFHPIEIKPSHGKTYKGVINNFYVQLSDNAHESRLKEVIEKYLRNNNYSLGGTEVHAAEELMDRLNVSDFDECISTQFHDCSEHARCFNLRGTYTCSCLEGFADLSVNTLYPGRICSSDAVGCAGCNYHGTCFERESAMFCECFKWYAGRTCQINLKAVLITVTVIGLVIILVVTIWASKKCCCQRGPATTQTFMIGCMQGMPSLHQGNMPSKQRADRRALIAERMETAETCSVQNTSLPYVPSKSRSRSCSKKCTIMSEPPSHAPPPPPAPALMIPRARLHPVHSDSRDNLSRRKSSEICSEAKLISYLESGAATAAEEMRRKHSVESSYSVNKERPNKQGALVSAGFKVSTTVRPDDSVKEDRDDASSINKTDLEAEMSRFDTLRKSYSHEDISQWTDAERRIGELTLSEARSVGGTLPASTGRAASSTRLTHQEANTMAERDLGSTFLLPHVHLYKPDLTSDVSEFDSL